MESILYNLLQTLARKSDGHMHIFFHGENDSGRLRSGDVDIEFQNADDLERQLTAKAGA